jgi:hypothetical protein
MNYGNCIMKHNCRNIRLYTVLDILNHFVGFEVLTVLAMKGAVRCAYNFMKYKCIYSVLSVDVYAFVLSSLPNLVLSLS